MIGVSNNKTTKADLMKYNGEYILDNICTKAQIIEELNGEFSFDGTFIISEEVDKKAYELMVNDSLITIDEEFGTEYFRIAKVIKNKKRYEIFARHITISEILTMFCEDVRPTRLNGNNAINWIVDHARGLNWLNVSSDIPTTNTAYYNKKTVYEALFNADNSFIEVWGGEVYRRGFNLAINQRVGSDRGVAIRSGKNLKGIEENSNLNTLITSIYPVGFDGITIKEKFINSPYINNYSKIYPSTIKFEDIKVKGEDEEEGYETLEEAQEELKRRANLMFTKDKVDILTSDYTITFAEIGKAEGYKDFALLETTWLGDTVNVYEEKLGLDIQVRVTKRVYDVIKKKRISTSLSNKDLNYKPPTIAQIVKELERIDSTETVLNLAKEQASTLIKNGLKDSYVIVRPNEILIMDTKDINTATKVWRFNSGGLGYSSTGYFGTYGLAMTMDGQIVADFITTGVLNASLIRAGILKSFNNKTWVNMEDGTFNFGGKLIFDGTNIEMNGKVKNGVEGYSSELNQGGLIISTTNEEVGGIRATSYPADKNINGLSIVATQLGDFIDLGHADTDSIGVGSKFTPQIRITKSSHELTGNFVGIQLLDTVKLAGHKKLLIESIDINHPHEIFNTTEGKMVIYGDNGIHLGYKNGSEYVTVMQIEETPGSSGSQVMMYKQLSMLGNNILSVPEIYTDTGAGRYLHEGWTGSVEKTAKRISNLSAFLDSGWYAYASGSNGSPPANWGTLLHLKLNSETFTQLAIGTNNTLYTRSWTNGAWNNWVER